MSDIIRQVVFEITNKTTKLNMVPVEAGYNGIKKLRIRMVSYTPSTINNRYMMISLDKIRRVPFFPGSASAPQYITKFIPLLPIVGGTIIFENNDTKWDFESVSGEELPQFYNMNLEAIINNDMSINDISVSNPLYITIDYIL